MRRQEWISLGTLLIACAWAACDMTEADDIGAPPGTPMDTMTFTDTITVDPVSGAGGGPPMTTSATTTTTGIGGGPPMTTSATTTATSGTGGGPPMTTSATTTGSGSDGGVPGCVESAPCDDGNACTTTDYCVGGECRGTPITCQDLGPCHFPPLCDPQQGCIQEPRPSGTPCDDGNQCTTDDACVMGQCIGGPECPESDCLEAGMCDAVNNTCIPGPAKPGQASCDDENPCTGPGMCNAGLCVTPPLDEGTPCDDANPCTQHGSCKGQACVSVPAPDGTPCGLGEEQGECIAETCFVHAEGVSSSAAQGAGGGAAAGSGSGSGGSSAASDPGAGAVDRSPFRMHGGGCSAGGAPSPRGGAGLASAALLAALVLRRRGASARALRVRATAPRA